MELEMSNSTRERWRASRRGCGDLTTRGCCVSLQLAQYTFWWVNDLSRLPCAGPVDVPLRKYISVKYGRIRLSMSVCMRYKGMVPRASDVSAIPDSPSQQLWFLLCWKTSDTATHFCSGGHSDRAGRCRIAKYIHLYVTSLPRYKTPRELPPPRPNSSPSSFPCFSSDPFPPIPVSRR